MSEIIFALNQTIEKLNDVLMGVSEDNQARVIDSILSIATKIDGLEIQNITTLQNNYLKLEK